MFHGILLASSWVFLVLVTANMSCFVLLFSDRARHDVVYPMCQSLLSVFQLRREGGTDEENMSWWRMLEGLLVKGFAIPFLILASLSVLLPRNSQFRNNDDDDDNNNNKKRRWLWTARGGDPNIYTWALVFVLFPCLLVTFLPQIATPKSVYLAMMTTVNEEKNEFMEEWKVRLAQLALVSGDSAVMALSLFLVPVAKHSPLIHVFGLSFPQALVFHKVAGWISLVFTILHGTLYLLDYANLFDNNSPKSMKAMLHEVIPPWRCWSLDALGYRSTGWGDMEENNNEHNRTLMLFRRQLMTLVSMEEQQEPMRGHQGCNRYWFNLSGFVSMVAFIVLGIFSLPKVRRHAYWLFYTIHVPAAWIMLLGAIVHITYNALFLVPNIIYYLGPTISVWVQQMVAARRKKNRGVRIESITMIAGSNGCCLVRLRGEQKLSTTTSTPPEEGNSFDSENSVISLGVCKICVPSISFIWHPFSTMKDPIKGDYMFLIRPTGPFTKELLERLMRQANATQNVSGQQQQQQQQPQQELQQHSLLQNEQSLGNANSVPNLLVDGIYPAEYRWLPMSLQHDSILLISGGVGIVPFLHLLSKLYHTLSESHSPLDKQHRLQRVSLHWYCREEGLVRFVCQEFLPWFLHGADTCNGFEEMHTNTEEDESSIMEQQLCEHFVDEGREEAVEEPRPIVFEVFIHVTSRTSRNDEDDNDRELSRLFLSQIMNPHLDNESNVPSMDTTFKFLDGAGEGLDEAYVALTNFGRHHLLRFVWFVSLMLMSSALSWWYYNRVTVRVRGNGMSLLIRAHVVLLSVIASVSFGLAFVWLRTKGFEGRASLLNYNTIAAGDASQLDSTEGIISNSNPNPNSIGGRIRRRICVTSGRPQVDKVIEHTIKSSHPGAIFCGPRKLRDSLKNAIRRQQTSKVCGPMPTPCVFYDEVSDI